MLKFRMDGDLMRKCEFATTNIMKIANLHRKLLFAGATLLASTAAHAQGLFCNSTPSALHDRNTICDNGNLSVYNPRYSNVCRWSPNTYANCDQTTLASQVRDYGFSAADCTGRIVTDSGWVANGTTTAANQAPCY